MTPEDSGASFRAEAIAIRDMSLDEARETWQCKLLYETRGRGKETEVVLCVLANLYLEGLPKLLEAAGLLLECPYLVGHAKVFARGQIVCDMMKTQNLRLRNVLLYDSEDEMIGKFRRIADKLKLADFDRMMLFRALKAWVSQDRRINHMGDRAA